MSEVIPTGDEDTVISLDGWRKRVGKFDRCKHLRTTIDQTEGLVECSDCGQTLSPFHVLLALARDEMKWFQRREALRREVEELRAYSPWLKAVKRLERIWRGRTMLPMCPHCRKGVSAEELTTAGTVSVEYEEARRRRDA